MTRSWLRWIEMAMRGLKPPHYTVYIATNVYVARGLQPPRERQSSFSVLLRHDPREAAGAAQCCLAACRVPRIHLHPFRVPCRRRPCRVPCRRAVPCRPPRRAAHSRRLLAAAPADSGRLRSAAARRRRSSDAATSLRSRLGGHEGPFAVLVVSVEQAQRGLRALAHDAEHRTRYAPRRFTRDAVEARRRGGCAADGAEACAGWCSRADGAEA